MQRLEEYTRRLGYQPWAAFELEGMHNNIERIQKKGLFSYDCWYRRTGRTARGFLSYLTNTMDHFGGYVPSTLFVESSFGVAASLSLHQRCEAVVDCLGISGLRIARGRGGYIDHDKTLVDPTNHHTDTGVTHVWNRHRQVTCLECLAVSSE